MLAGVVLVQLASLASAIPLHTLTEDVNSVVVVRDKREPSRSFTFSGFMPGSGMSAFASSADYPRRPEGWGLQPPPQDKPWSPPAEAEKGEGEIDEREGEEEEAPATRPPKKNRKKYRPQQAEDEDEYERPGRGGSGGNAAASFNAWFPIMLGMYPNQGYPGQGDGFRGAQGARDPPGHTTVIANSVSHGRSGVASSHAVAYSGGGGPAGPQASPQAPSR